VRFISIYIDYNLTISLINVRFPTLSYNHIRSMLIL